MVNIRNSDPRLEIQISYRYFIIVIFFLVLTAVSIEIIIPLFTFNLIYQILLQRNVLKLWFCDRDHNCSCGPSDTAQHECGPVLVKLQYCSHNCGLQPTFAAATRNGHSLAAIQKHPNLYLYLQARFSCIFYSDYQV